MSGKNIKDLSTLGGGINNDTLIPTSNDGITLNKSSISDLSNLYVSKDLTNIPSNVDYVVESYSDENGNWYRVYKSGWIEQGGIWLTTMGTGRQTISLLKPMKDINYQINMTTGDNTGGNSYYNSSFNWINIQFMLKTTSSFQVSVYSDSVSSGRCWSVIGHKE